MKTTLFYSVLFIGLFTQLSCSSDSSSSSSSPNTIDQNLITGWWYRPEGDMTIYKAYYFGADGIYKQDMTNFPLGIGEGTWVWENSTKIKMTPVNNILGGIRYIEITKLTNDSLVGMVDGQQQLKISRTSHEN